MQDKHKQENLREQLALWHCPGIGALTFKRLMQCFADLSELFRANHQQSQRFQLSEAVCRYLRRPDWRAVDAELAWMEQSDHHHIITQNDPHYPRLLKEISSAPPILYIKGQLAVLNRPQMAMVGSRQSTQSGQETARYFAKQLAEQDIIVTSGLALGIDAASHQGCLSGGGYTIAVLGSGLQQIYPKRHAHLAEQIVQSGGLVSEFPLATLPKARHFPQRNRIISGLSMGVLVVEASMRSGSLITARCALEQGREVFAIPASIHSPVAQGCHFLIQQGAKLVQSLSDILQEVGSISTLFVDQEPCRVPQQKLAAKQQALVQCIGYQVNSVDLIAKRSGLSLAELTTLLVELECLGHIQAVPGGYVRVLAL